MLLFMLSTYLGQFGVGARQQRAAEALLGANGSREGRRRKHGRHHVDACDPGLHLLTVPVGRETDVKLGTFRVGMFNWARSAHFSLAQPTSP